MTNEENMRKAITDAEAVVEESGKELAVMQEELEALTKRFRESNVKYDRRTAALDAAVEAFEEMFGYEA